MRKRPEGGPHAHRHRHRRLAPPTQRRGPRPCQSVRPAGAPWSPAIGDRARAIQDHPVSVLPGNQAVAIRRRRAWSSPARFRPRRHPSGDGRPVGLGGAALVPGPAPALHHRLSHQVSPLRPRPYRRAAILALCLDAAISRPLGGGDVPIAVGTAGIGGMGLRQCGGMEPRRRCRHLPPPGQGFRRSAAPPLPLCGPGGGGKKTCRRFCRWTCRVRKWWSAMAPPAPA